MDDGTLKRTLDGAVAVPPAVRCHSAGSRYAVCRLCRGPAAPGRTLCWSCRRVGSQLGGSPSPVVPLFLFALGSAAHRALVGYKAAASSAVRSAKSHELEWVLAAFFERHIACVVGASRRPVLIVPVPSTIGGRPSWGGRHPLGRVVEGVLGSSGVAEEAPFDLHLAELLRGGRQPPRRLEARAGGFEVLAGAGRELTTATVVVIDDVFTSGARGLSVAAALRAAGADVAAVVPIGRLVRPDHNSATAAFWADWSRSAWHPSSCAACRPKRSPRSLAGPGSPLRRQGWQPEGSGKKEPPEAADGELKACDAHGAEIGDVGGDSRRDEANVELADQGDSLIERRPGDHSLKPARVDAERVENGREQEEGQDGKEDEVEVLPNSSDSTSGPCRGPQMQSRRARPPESRARPTGSARGR